MTVQMNIAEAKAKLAELVRRAEAGEEVLIARGGAPVAKLVAANPKPDRTPRMGAWAHLGPLSEADLKELEEPLYSEAELDEMIETWGVLEPNKT
jgi:prevent-host-death family protein